MGEAVRVVGRRGVVVLVAYSNMSGGGGGCDVFNGFALTCSSIS